MKIAFGCDHGGFVLKAPLFEYFDKSGIEVTDCGAYSGDEPVDYPVYAQKVGKLVQSGDVDFGVLACGTGVGVSVVANKMKGIRCALVGDTFTAHATREHNDANVIALGGRVTGPDLAVDIVDAFLATEFSKGERHLRRLALVAAMEEE